MKYKIKVVGFNGLDLEGDIISSKKLMDREILTETIGLEQLGVVATVTPSKDELCKVIKSKGFDVDLNQEKEDIIDELTGLLMFPFNDIEILDKFSRVSYQWEVWPTEEDMVDWNDLEEEYEMEYRNIIEELMDTKVKELLDKPFGAVMDLNHVVRYNLSNIIEASGFLDKRLWQEILSNEKVASLNVIEKWENIYGGEFLVLDSSNGIMSGIIIFVDGTINYTHFSTAIKDDGPWEMSRLKGNKLGNYYSSFDDIYFEDLMPDEIY